MARYYVNDKAQPNGDHEVHREGCAYMPVLATYLGQHENCGSAVVAARKLYPQANGCYWCSRPCHTG